MGILDKAKHRAEELLGKSKQSLGNATDDDSLKGEGMVDEKSGQVKQQVDEAKDTAHGTLNQAKDKLSGE